MAIADIDDPLSATTSYLTDIHPEYSCLFTASSAQAACIHRATLKARKSLAVHGRLAQATQIDWL